MENFGYVKKINEEQFIVNADLNVYNSGYGVVPREQDPECKYDIAEVKQYVAEHPEMLFEHYNYEPDRSKDSLFDELAEHEEWLATVYDLQVKQYQRCVRLGLPYDSKYGTIAELDNVAMQKATRIRELRTLLQLN